MRISQNGNTANNGFHNALILASDHRVSLVAKTSLGGNYHAFSQPAWDVIGYPVQINPVFPAWQESLRDLNRDFVTSSLFPRFLDEPTATNSNVDEYFLRLKDHGSSDLSTAFMWHAHAVSSMTKDDQLSVWHPKNKLLQKALTFATRTRTRLAELSPASTKLLANSDVHITFGNVRPRYEPDRDSPLSVVIEHGQIRWLADGSDNHKYERRLFQRLCEASQHIWLTNLDQRTLDIATELFPNKWDVLPHPYVLDPSCPYPEIDGIRSQLVNELNSDFLVLNASSLSIGGDQRKGVDKLLQALNALRTDRGIRIGLVLVRWGTNVEEVVQMVHSLGLDDQCRFVDPLPRVALQRLMASFDLVSDQFDYDAFGALTIRTLEQGMPLLSRPIGEEAARLIGGRPPIVEASSSEEIFARLEHLYADIQEIGRERFRLKYEESARHWIVHHHHHQTTRQLQIDRYQELLSSAQSPAEPGTWGRSLFRS